MSVVKEWEARGQYKTVNGHKIFYIDENPSGASETIVLIHGFPTSSWDWEAVLPGLLARYRVIAMDMLGFGLSDKPNPHRYSIHEQADLIDGLLMQLGLSECHLWVHDYGVSVGQELLARANAGGLGYHVKSVCFLNGGLFPETHHALLMQKLLLSPIGPVLTAVTGKSTFDRSMGKVWGAHVPPSPAVLQAFWDFILHNNGKHLFHNLMSYILDRREHRERWIGAIGEFKGPVGLINGSLDPVSGAHMVDRFIELLGEPAYLDRLDMLGHYPHVEDPDAVLASYFTFLDGVDQPDISK